MVQIADNEINIGGVKMKFHVLVCSFEYGSLSSLVNIREHIRSTHKRDRLEIFNDVYSFDELEKMYKEGYGYYGEIVYGFESQLMGEAYLTRSEITEILKWDTNLLVFNMHNGHEY
jgi:hypothetical protein